MLPNQTTKVRLSAQKAMWISYSPCSSYEKCFRQYLVRVRVRARARVRVRVRVRVSLAVAVAVAVAVALTVTVTLTASTRPG